MTTIKFSREEYRQLRMLAADRLADVRVIVQSRAKTRLATVRPGIDNFAFSPGGRMFVSHFVDGGVSEILAGGKERAIVAAGFVGPFDLSVTADGRVFVADGLSLAEIARDRTCVRRARLLEAGWPGFVRGVAVAADGSVYVTNSAGDLVRLFPGEREVRASGLGDTHGLAVASDGSVLVADADGGRIVRVDDDGAVYAGEAAKGRVVRVDAGLEVVIDGLREPHGIAVAGGAVAVLDRAARTVVVRERGSKSPAIIASNLPVGDAPGVVPKPLPGLPGLLPGPIGAFAGMAGAADGVLYVAADSEGSVLRIARRS